MLRPRRLVGIDLGVTSSHTVVVCDETGEVLARRRAYPTAESLTSIEQVALAGAADGVVLEVIVEPTSMAWFPVAVFFAERGHVVFRVTSAKSADMRKLLSRHAKTNQIDAEALARLPIVDRAGLVALELPRGDNATLVRRVRAADRISYMLSRHKQRIRDLARVAMPTVGDVLTGEIAKADLAVLERWGDPRALKRAGQARVAALVALVAKVSKGQLDAEVRSAAWIRAAEQALALYGDSDAVAFEDIAAEIASQIRLLRACQAELAAHAEARETAYLACDPEGLARSLPGVHTIGGPILVAAMGRPGRFRNGSAFKAFTGLTPKASETGDTDKKGQAMSRAGASWLRAQLIRCATSARQIDPQLAEIYWRQMVERGAHHNKATCVVAARLAERAWAVMVRGEAYVVRDIDGRPVDRTEARAIIAERYRVPEEVRRRRRSRKWRKAPQNVLLAQSLKSDAQGVDKRGDLPPTTTLPVDNADVKHDRGDEQAVLVTG